MPFLHSEINSNPHFTFTREKFLRCTEVQKVKKKYCTEKRKFVFPPEGDETFILWNVWISKRNLSKVAFIIADKSIDINTIEYDSLPRLGVMVIHKLDVNALSSINQLIKNTNTNYYKIPFINRAYNPRFLESDDKYCALICEGEGDEEEEFKIVTDQVYMHDQYEIDDLIRIGHIYIIKKAITYEYQTTAENPKIELLSPYSMAYIMVQTEKNVTSLLASIKHHNDKIRIYELTIDDPDFDGLAMEDRNTFIIDPLDNMHNDLELIPKGAIHVSEGSFLEVDGEQKVSVTYVLFDQIEYSRHIILTHNRGIDVIAEEDELELVEAAHEEGGDEVIAQEEKPVHLPPVIAGRNLAVCYEDCDEYEKWMQFEGLFKMYTKSFEDVATKSARKFKVFLLWTFKKVSKAIAANKLLDEERDTCILSFEKIKNGGYYYSCPGENCNKTFDHDTCHNCIMYTNTFFFECPNCFSYIQSLPPVYRNYYYLCGLKYGTWTHMLIVLLFIGSIVGLIYIR